MQQISLLSLTMASLRRTAASVFSSRSWRVLLPLLVLLTGSALVPSRAAASDDPHIYLYDDEVGLIDVTSSYDGQSVMDMQGNVIYINICSNLTGAGQHVTDICTGGNGSDSALTGAGQHVTDICAGGSGIEDALTGAGQHVTDICTGDVIGFVW